MGAIITGLPVRSTPARYRHLTHFWGPVEIVAPELLSWSEPEVGMTTTSTFTELSDGRTEVVITQSNVPEMFRSPEALEGFACSLARFDAYLATLV